MKVFSSISLPQFLHVAIRAVLLCRSSVGGGGGVVGDGGGGVSTVVCCSGFFLTLFGFVSDVVDTSSSMAETVIVIYNVLEK